MEKVKNLELQVGDELRGNSSYGSIHLYRNGCNLGLIASGMKLAQNLEGFWVFTRLFVKKFGSFNVQPKKDPWILGIE